MTAADDLRFPAQTLRQFARDCLVAAGAADAEAKIVAQVMVWTDLTGRELQGVARLPVVIKRLQSGGIRSPSRPTFTQLGETVFHLNGRHGFGRYLGHLAITRAAETAANFGLGLVVVSHSNHFGANAFYAHQAAAADCLGVVTSNAFPKVAPHGATSPIFGTNPLAFSAPLRSGESVLIDMSTSVYAGSIVRAAGADGNMLAEPGLINKDGDFVTDPAHEEYSAFLPISGPKGTGLALLVEILSGVISGAAMSTQLGSFFDHTRSQNLGHAFLAIYLPTLLPMSEYYQRLEWLLTLFKAADPIPGQAGVRYPGELRWQRYHEQAGAGIQLQPSVLQALNHVAGKLSISTL